MQLKLQRTQRMGGAFGNKVLFCLDARAEYAPAEQADIRKYKLGSEVIYSSRAAKKHLENAGAHLDRTQSGGTGERAAGLARGVVSLAMAKMQLSISIASLGRGHHIECKDLGELMEAEEAVMNACRNLRDYLKLAATFNGSIVLVDFEDGEKVHQSDGTLQIAGPTAADDEHIIDGEVVSPGDAEDVAVQALPLGTPAEDMGRWLAESYAQNPKPFWIGGSAAAGLLIVLIFGFSFLTVLLAGAVVGGTILWSERR
jgi:hypothetical protein